MEYHPHQFVNIVENGDIEPLMKSESLYRCLSCFACVERCPRGVAPAAIIEAVRQEVIRMQGENRVKAEEIPQIVDDKIPQQLLVSMFRKYNK
jgi:heterodisulfide reductase subunit C